MSQAWRSGAAGANPTPQLPIATVVTPCNDDGAIIESQVACPSKWVWMSMKPGVTMAPSASISRGAEPGTEPTAVMTSSVTSTSPRPGAPPVPSTIVPFRMIRSAISATPVQRRPLFGRTTRAIVSRFGGDGLRQ